MRIEALRKQPEIIENKINPTIFPRIGTIRKIIKDEIKNNGFIELIRDFKEMEKKDQKACVGRTVLAIAGITCVSVGISKVLTPALGIHSGNPDLKELGYGVGLMALGTFLLYKGMSGD